MKSPSLPETCGSMDLAGSHLVVVRQTAFHMVIIDLASFEREALPDGRAGRAG
jgi:hypothetical protein